MTSLIEDVDQVLSACGVSGPVVVVGNSGGLLGLGLALKSPARVRGLVLLKRIL